MSNKKTIAFIITYSVALMMFGLDQATKQMIIDAMPITIDVANTKYTTYKSYEFLPFLWFTHVVNFGSAFSAFYGQKALLLTLVGAIMIGMIYYERQSASSRHKILSYSLGFLLGGALGNWFDRARLGYVTDFLDFRINSQNVFPIFNVADISVNIGIGLLIIYTFFLEPKIKKEEENMEDDEMPNSRLT